MAMKNIKYVPISIIVLILLLLASSVILYYRFPTPSNFRSIIQNHNVLIAHAGGSIDAYHYTNSLEALEQAKQNDFKFIELDLVLTSDKHIVAAHDWKHFHDITGAKNSEQPLNHKEFTERHIFGTLTPITAERINLFFKNYSEAYLVTDKIRDYTALLTQLTIPADRLLVEVFSYGQYKRALRAGVMYPMLCIWDKKDFEKYNLHLTFNRIAIITLPVALIPQIENELEELYKKGISIFAFSSNELPVVKKYINKTVTGFYTDNLTPKDVR